VPLHCESCITDVNEALKTLDGVETVECDLTNQLITVHGNSAPSRIIKAMQDIGRDAIVRGTGKPNSAAVCILEAFDDNEYPVKGLARIVAVSPTQALFDITLNGLPKGKYYPSIRMSGDISNGPLSTGPEYLELGEVEVGHDLNTRDMLLAQARGFSGQEVVKRNVSITDLIGRGIVVSTSKTEVASNSLCGVIARSAGIWENVKTICSCSGKTIWQERKDAVSKGIN
jgi:copper chaperone for superoxide dismutase